MLELYLGLNREMNAYVAAVLSEALHGPVRALAASAPTGVDKHDASAGEPRISSFARRALLTLATLLGLTGAVLFCLPPAGPAIGFYVLMVAGVPAGIALGTQKKEYYV
jgi:hypothetical protein